MGYLKKGGTVCNPAKKSLTVFQNSYIEDAIVREYGIDGKPRAYMTNWNGDGGWYTSYMPIPIEFVDERGNKYTLQPGQNAKKANWTDQFDVYSVKSLDPNYIVTFKSSASAWRDFYVDHIIGTRTAWNTKWSKRSA